MVWILAIRNLGSSSSSTMDFCYCRTINLYIAFASCKQREECLLVFVMWNVVEGLTCTALYKYYHTSFFQVEKSFKIDSCTWTHLLALLLFHSPHLIPVCTYLSFFPEKDSRALLKDNRLLIDLYNLGFNFSCKFYISKRCHFIHPEIHRGNQSVSL